MIYKVIGLMSGSSLDGLDIVYTELHENAGKWTYEILAADCYEYDEDWTRRLRDATKLNALEYQLLHTEYGHYTGRMVNRFIEENELQYKVSLIGSHGHTTFHLPAKKMTAQLGDGAAIAATTGLVVVSDLRALDVALGGQGAPIIPIGEKLLFGEYDYFLNIGGIANISFNDADKYIAFDVCPANRVLNMIASKDGEDYDEGGRIARAGNVHAGLLQLLNQQEYYNKAYPKSLANNFGTETIYPLITSMGLSANDAMRTMVEHIVQQVTKAVAGNALNRGGKMLVTGGGAFNDFLVERLADSLNEHNVSVVIPGKTIVAYKEALVMALIGVLRWRQESNVLSTVTGALRNSIGGALWTGQES